MVEAVAFIRRQTAISVVINVVLSAAFFFGVFGLSGAVRVWGPGAYVFDFLPHGFMIGLMATLVPGLLARKALLGGKVASFDGTSRWPRRLLLRAPLFGLMGAGAGVALAAAAMSAATSVMLAHTPALLAKLLFGALLAAVVTPTGLRAELSSR